MSPPTKDAEHNCPARFYFTHPYDISAELRMRLHAHKWLVLEEIEEDGRKINRQHLAESYMALCRDVEAVLERIDAWCEEQTEA